MNEFDFKVEMIEKGFWPWQPDIWEVEVRSPGPIVRYRAEFKAMSFASHYNRKTWWISDDLNNLSNRDLIGCIDNTVCESFFNKSCKISTKIRKEHKRLYERINWW